jgi:ubiquinone/menaquinone biosynthesis C-methylase UbiE
MDAVLAPYRVGRRATGDVLEIAAGTGLNLAHYPPGCRLTGIDTSPAMLRIAASLGRAVDLREGDATGLDFPDDSFDTVVCSLSLCAIPDEQQAIAEMWRVLHPGGLLLLVDHIAARTWPIRAIQRLLELPCVPLGGENFLRRPLTTVTATGFDIQHRQRFTLGIVERLAARKPAHEQPATG